jgi:hypothetical protein
MKRALALLAPAVLTIGLVACSSDDDDSPTTTDAAVATTESTTESTTEATVTAPTTAGDDEETGAGGSVDDDDTLRRVFPDLSDDQLSCLSDSVGDVTETLDPSQAQAIAEECNIDPADLTPDVSGLSIPDNMGEMMQQVFPGLSDEQVSCLVEQLGDDFDIAKAQRVAETCNIDPSDLTPG